MRIRKTICILLALTMLFSLTACGGEAASSGDTVLEFATPSHSVVTVTWDANV